MIGYVCTNYNNSHYTVEAVKSLISGHRHACEVVVVDNCSRREGVEELKNLSRTFPQVKLILNPENVGYFRGLNIGIKDLRSRRPEIEWIVVGNNDLVFPEDFGDKLDANAAKLRSHAVISPDIVTVDGEHQNPHVISGIGPVREIFYDIYYTNYYLGLLIQKMARLMSSLSERSDEEQWEVARPIYQGHGSCYLLGPRFFEQFSELWAPTFLMSEEYFLSKQLSDVGQSVYYDPSLQVIHQWHGALDQLPSRTRWQMAREAHRVYRQYVGIFGQKNRTAMRPCATNEGGIR